MRPRARQHRARLLDMETEPFIFLWIGNRKLPRHSVQLGLRLRTAHPWFQAGDYVQQDQAARIYVVLLIGGQLFPFALWHVVGYLSEFLPNPPITRNQVELMEMDNVAESARAGFEALRIAPQPIENILPQIVAEASRLVT